MAALRNKYVKQVSAALECDGWGQVVEAVDHYEELSRSMNKEKADISHSSEDRALLEKLAITYRLRRDALNDPMQRGLKLADVQKTKAIVESLFTSAPAAFTIDLTPYQSSLLAASNDSIRPSDSVVTSIDDRGGLTTHDSAQGGSLKAAAGPFADGGTRVTIRIDRIGLKNATQYVEPYITISVVSASGREIGDSQDSPISTDKKELSVMYGVDVHLQSSLEDIPDNAAVFFEFKHYKPKKQKVSTRCFSFIERQDIKPGVLALPIYRKPTDFKRAKLKPLSVKPLHLHVKISTLQS